ncbi:alkaline phosphatase PhoX [Reichenbachiella sp. MSK19-1]|uniref:alkaline phosphatase PhoX n=1 Tax=Reichenbachiella sp. MSK19-1 TaxID=1897631 RepID=UPI000E6BE562|nr:alkaline phosphatase PhoX [Reichenbachiella sp. MSK19-1]RJE72769.1 phosphatase [Reichenbachiella sp. MSK19-1]
MNSRRKFIKQSAVVSIGFAGLAQYLTHCSFAKKETMTAANQWLELPKGFEAKIISQWGEKMSDGFFVPSRADGMAAFDLDGKVVLIRNHENSPNPIEFGPFGKDLELFDLLHKEQFYDHGFGKNPSLGGTTTVVFDEEKQEVEKQFLSLIGTNRNCAGGPTPWNTWITCEEDTTPQGEENEQSHGYNFEIPVSGTGLIVPKPIKAMGRFNHEAVAVDPSTGIVYQTEDQHDSLIYRYLPHVPGELHEGGVLQALVIKDQSSFDTRNIEQQALAVGQSLAVEWMTLDNVESPADDLRHRGFEAGAAVFDRGEGMWYGNEEVYFACTNGGKNRSGQVFKYKPSPFEGTDREAEQPGVLTLFAEPNDTEILKFCDNLTVSPWGDVILVEDVADAYIRGIKPNGEIYNIGRNVGSKSELTGVCFSPSGKTLFVNVQEEGLTMAITGPWDQLRDKA